MSTHLKTIYIISLGLLAAFGWHFGTVLGLFGSAPETQTAFIIRIGGILIAFFVTFTIAFMMVAKRDEDAVTPDEREEKIELKAERNGFFAIYAGLLCLMWFVFTPMTPMQIANGILAIVCFTEITKLLSGLYFLRKGE